MGTRLDAERVRLDPMLRRGNRPLNPPCRPSRRLLLPPLRNQARSCESYAHEQERVGPSNQVGASSFHSTC